MEIIKWVLLAVSFPIIGWLVVRTTRNARMLNQRIDEYHREQEELQRQAKQEGKAINPYEQMMQIYNRQEETDKDK